jgi:drug/metabolite transporter (DMT)-like permease
LTKHHKIIPYLFIAIATILIGMSGPVAKMMDLYPPFVIWARCVIGFIALAVINFFTTGKLSSLPLLNKGILITGFLMCFHWVLYFYSISLSTVAVAIVAVFTYPLQSILFEFFLTKKPVDKAYLFISFIVLAGVYLLSPGFSLKNSQTIGLLLGLLSGGMLATRNIMSRNLMEKYSPNIVHVSQVLISGILLLPFALSETYDQIKINFIPLASLGIFTTAVGHLLLMKSLQHFSATEVGLLNGAQPVAAIVIAFFLVREVPSPQVFAGATIILTAVMYAVWQISKK